tara:strand:+ start:368 stop:514 length:147 start_codon:yes stop_codon:yes gene_type:complete
MLIETTEVLKVSNYARAKGVSITWVNRLIKEGKLEVILIDNIRFIKKD